MPLRYHHHRHRLDDRHGYAPVSRFLSPAVQQLMEVRHAGPRLEPTFTASPAGTARDGVRAVDALLADLWS